MFSHRRRVCCAWGSRSLTINSVARPQTLPPHNAEGVLYLGFLLEFPSVFSGSRVFSGGDIEQLSWLVGAGFAQAAAVPVIFELAVELAFSKSGAPEATSGSMIVFLWNFSSMVTIFTARCSVFVIVRVMCRGLCLALNQPLPLSPSLLYCRCCCLCQ
jgi:hypothetical protein